MSSPVSPTFSTTHLLNPPRTRSNTFSSFPKSSFWKKLKAENEERKKNAIKHVTADEAKTITGYGDDKKARRYTSANEACMLDFEYDPGLTWGEEEARKIVEGYGKEKGT